MRTQKTAFTLVELVVVVTILSILSSIGFISYSSYLTGTRDTNRISQLNGIYDGLLLYSLTNRLPVADDKINIVSGAETIAYQGYAGNNVLEKLSFIGEGLDPKDKEYFTYYLGKDKKHFQLMAYLEEEKNIQESSNISIIVPTLEGRYPTVYGNHLGILTDKDSVVIQEVASIKTAGVLDISDVGDLELISYIDNGDSMSGTGTTFTPLSHFSSVGGSFCSSLNLTCTDFSLSWGDVDENCLLPDVIIGNQVWAGCNSTLGNGVEFGKKDDGTNGAVATCFDYNDNDTGSCVIDSIEMKSNTNADTWFSGTNLNGDSEVSNIWGKFYIRSNARSACYGGYHLPTDAEWEYLEEYMFVEGGGAADCRTTTGWNCDGIGWSGNNTKSITDNIIKALNLPLLGMRASTGVNFNNRGRNADLWTATSFDASNSFRRQFLAHMAGVNKDAVDKNLAFGVRCIKD